jgi:hypothetical protein
MQGVDAIDDLLERAVRDDAGQYDIGRLQYIGPGGEGGGAVTNRRDERFVLQHRGARAAFDERPAELVSVPPLPGRQDDDVSRAYFVSTPIDAENPPVAKFGMSPATFWKAGVDVPALRASIEANVSSALR